MEIEERDEIAVLDELSFCCEAPITESGFCTECWDNAK